MRILMVTPYPPVRDGIASYAAQAVAGYRQEGNTVEVVSPDPSAGAFHLPFRTWRGAARLTRLARRADRVVVQFHPEIFFMGMQISRFVRGWVGLMAWVGVCRDTEMVVHEAPYEIGGRLAPLRIRMWRALWGQAAVVSVHTEHEAGLMTSVMGVDSDRLRVIEHGARFRPRCELDRAGARRLLGLDPDAYVFLCAGFLQPHKGFDRAANALVRIKGDRIQLHIVGEMRVETPEHLRYLELLRTQAGEDERVFLHDGYVNDEEFDYWMVACDSVVLPYREIWSSSVVERAGLYGRPVVVSDVGGLSEQISPPGVVVSTGEELVAAMASLAGTDASDPPVDPCAGSPRDRAAALVARRSAALRDWVDPLDDDDTPALDLPVARVTAEPLRLAPVPAGMGARTYVKAVVRRLTGWELEPMIRYINALRSETLGRPGDGTGPAPD